VVGYILAARPVDCVRVVIDAGDEDRLFVMSKHDQPEVALAAHFGGRRAGEDRAGF
jgi:hypothetical protein